MTEQPKRHNLRIASSQNHRSWLHIDEAFDIGKVRIWIGNREHGKATGQSQAYLDIAGARVLFADLFQHGAPKEEIAVFGGSVVDGALQSRIFSVQEDPARKNPIIFAIAYGPGKRTKTGAIQPASKQMARVSIFLDRLAARKLAGEVLGAIAAWEAATFLERRQAEELASSPISDATLATLENDMLRTFPDEAAFERHRTRALAALELGPDDVDSLTEAQGRQWIAKLAELRARQSVR